MVQATCRELQVEGTKSKERGTKSKERGTKSKERDTKTWNECVDGG